MVFCVYCGNKMNDTANFCVKCGQKLVKPVATTTNSRTRPSPRHNPSPPSPSRNGVTTVVRPRPATGGRPVASPNQDRRKREEEARKKREAEERRRREETARRQREAAEAQRRKKEAEANKKRKEEEARRKAEATAAARKREEEARKKREAEERRRREETARRQREATEAQRRKKEAEANKKRKEEEARRKAEATAAARKQEENRRQREAAARAKQDEAARLRAQEALRKRQEEEKRLQQQAAEEQRKRIEEAKKKRAAAEKARKPSAPVISTTPAPTSKPVPRRPAASAPAGGGKLGNKWEQMMQQKEQEKYEASREVIRARRRKGAKHVDEQIRKLVLLLKSYSAKKGHPNPPGVKGLCLSVKFGDLFSGTQGSMSEIAATLAQAKKKGVVHYEGVMLQQGYHDNTLITLVKEGFKETEVFKSTYIPAPKPKGASMAPKKCCVCGKTAFITERIEANGQTFHRSCFRCKMCNSALRLASYSFVNNTYYCKPCFSRGHSSGAIKFTS